MTIETKYNIGDEVWFMFDNSAKNSRIAKIELTVEEDMCGEAVCHCIFYQLFGKYDKLYPQHDLFSTKEELLKSL